MSPIAPVCDASADQRSQRFKSSTEWRFSAEPRVSMGLGVPDRKGCASSKVMSKLGASVAIADNSEVYGELSASTTDEMQFDNLDVGVKLGVKIGL